MGLNEIYETCKIYKANPCDIGHMGGRYSPFKALGKLFTTTYALANTGCQCCSGARIWLALLIAFALGHLL